MAPLRRALGWSQAELAARSGVSRAGVSAIETGRLVPSVAAALGIAAALGETVEAVFGGVDRADAGPAWAWSPPDSHDGRIWHAAVERRTLAFPVEPTAAGLVAHDAWFDGVAVHPRGEWSPERTLVVAGCDPTVGLLVRELAWLHRIRVIPLLRSSRDALDLLRQGLVHAAGVHVTDSHGRSANAAVVRSRLGRGYRLLHQVRWESGIALVPARRERSVAAVLRANVRWVNREEGSAARDTFDALLASRRPHGYDHVVRDHRAVATTVASGWAEAGVCVAPAAAEARLSFIPLQREAYELCVAERAIGDPRVAALVATLQSPTYRQLLADVPGCDTTHTGDVKRVA